MSNGAVIPNTTIAVDYWHTKRCRWLKHFFLSHMHTDHIHGLTPSWRNQIYCSEVTKKLLIHQLKIDENLITSLEIGVCTTINGTGGEDNGFTVTPFDANHCPGAVMFLFEGSFGKIFYTADFRCDDAMLDTLKAHNIGKMDVVYADNTYFDKSVNFPTKSEAKSKIFDVIRNHPQFQVVIVCYNLGKEDLLVDIAVEFHEWVIVSREKFEMLKLLDLPNVFSDDTKNGRIRVTSAREMRRFDFKLWVQSAPTIVIFPTGMFTKDSNPHDCSGFKEVFFVPYSDHSCYSELVEFLHVMKPIHVVPIVKKRGKDRPQNGKRFPQFQISPRRLQLDLGLRKKSAKPSFHESDDAKPLRQENHASKERVKKRIAQLQRKLSSNKGVVFDSDIAADDGDENVSSSTRYLADKENGIPDSSAVEFIEGATTGELSSSENSSSFLEIDYGFEIRRICGHGVVNKDEVRKAVVKTITNQTITNLSVDESRSCLVKNFYSKDNKSEVTTECCPNVQASRTEYESSKNTESLFELKNDVAYCDLIVNNLRVDGKHASPKDDVFNEPDSTCCILSDDDYRECVQFVETNKNVVNQQQRSESEPTSDAEGINGFNTGCQVVQEISKNIVTMVGNFQNNNDDPVAENINRSLAESTSHSIADQPGENNTKGQPNLSLATSGDFKENECESKRNAIVIDDSEESKVEDDHGLKSLTDRSSDDNANKLKLNGVIIVDESEDESQVESEDEIQDESQRKNIPQIRLPDSPSGGLKYGIGNEFTTSEKLCPFSVISSSESDSSVCGSQSEIDKVIELDDDSEPSSPSELEAIIYEPEAAYELEATNEQEATDEPEATDELEATNEPEGTYESEATNESEANNMPEASNESESIPEPESNNEQEANNDLEANNEPEDNNELESNNELCVVNESQLSEVWDFTNRSFTIVPYFDIHVPASSGAVSNYKTDIFQHDDCLVTDSFPPPCDTDHSSCDADARKHKSIINLVADSIWGIMNSLDISSEKKPKNSEGNRNSNVLVKELQYIVQFHEEETQFAISRTDDRNYDSVSGNSSVEIDADTESSFDVEMNDELRENDIQEVEKAGNSKSKSSSHHSRKLKTKDSNADDNYEPLTKKTKVKPKCLE